MKKTLILLGMLALTPQLKAQLLLEALDAPDTPNPLIQSKCIERVKDKYYGDGDHNFIYCAVMGPNGKKWLNLNLGAEYAREPSHRALNPHFNPEAQPTGHNDWKAFGSLFQEGRKADGHELVTYLHKSIVQGFPYNDEENNDNWYVERKSGVVQYPIEPINSLPAFVWGDDWTWDRSNIHNLWGGDMINNPCPNGYRIMNERDIMELFVDDHTKIKRDVNQGYRTAAIYSNIDYPNLIIMTPPSLFTLEKEYQDRLQKTSTGYTEQSGVTSALWLSTKLNTQLNYDLNEPFPGWKNMSEPIFSSDKYYYSTFDTGVINSTPGAKYPLSTVGLRPTINNASYAIRCVEM